jgi:hypothetical protein
VIDTGLRLQSYPFALQSELHDAAHEQGYRINQGEAAGWLFYTSATAPGEIAVAATSAGLDGPFFLSVQHPGAARELKAVAAGPPAKGHAAAFAFQTRDALFAGVSGTYRLSVSLPSQPFEDFKRDTAHLGDTEADQIAKRRIGQDRFRAALLSYWNGACPLTGVRDTDLLRASHIIPWAQCKSDEERLNVYNGLLLSALWDAAFDAGLLSFDDDGRPLLSPQLGQEARHALNITNAATLSLTDAHRRRLDWHRRSRWLAG